MMMPGLANVDFVIICCY